VNLLPDRHAKFVIIQWIACVVPTLANLLMHSQCALSEPILPFWWRRVHEDASQGMYMSKI
jgi:hypothetical protein